MTPRDDVRRARAEYHRAIDTVLRNLHTTNFDELISLCENHSLAGMSRGFAAGGSLADIAPVRRREDDLAELRRRLVHSFHFPAQRYAGALREAAATIGNKEIAEAYQEELADLLQFKTSFTRTLMAHLERHDGHPGSSDLGIPYSQGRD
jgi:hypothetical protein